MDDGGVHRLGPAAPSKLRLSDLIGGRWNTPEDSLLDIATAVGFWIVSAAVLVGLACSWDWRIQRRPVR